MTVQVPVDQATRDRIRDNIGRNMCVEAGAGTGKTTIMVARIIEIIRTDYAQIDEMVIITFTEKAAAELATRVREALEHAQRDSEDEIEQERFGNALRSIYRARIETIHAFASSLLRERPVEAHLDPNFEVLDTLRADLGFDEQFRTWLDDYLGDEEETGHDTSDFRRALNRGLEIAHFRTVCELIHRHRHMLPLDLPVVEDPDVFAFRDFLLDEASELRALLPSAVDRDDKGVTEIHKVLGFAARCERAGNDRERLERVILAGSKTSETAGNKGNWDPSSHNTEQKSIRKNINQTLLQIQQELRSSALCSVLPLAQNFARTYEQIRRFAGQAEFEDLLIWARNLLRDELHVRKDFQERFKCLLVDEFQDTDPLQVEIVMYLASEGQEETDWTKLNPTPGKLFVVGDPKQSIYRFRRADIAIYEQVKQEILEGNLEYISQNFRSVPEVIDWINQVFGVLIQRNERVQPEYVELHAFQNSRELEISPVVVVHSPEPATNADPVREEEARLLAGTILQAVEQGWPVRDESREGTRPVRFGDIAILLPTRTKLNLYEDALIKAAIPFRHEGGKEYFQRQEIRDLRACLRAVDNPGDAMSIVAALRSGAFGCSDQELFQWQLSNKGFDYRDVENGTDDPVAAGLFTLRSLHEERINLSLPEIVERTIERTNLVEFALTMPNGGDQSAANLLKMVDQARAFSGAGGGGLRAFVRWTITSAETRSDESDAAVAESTDDVVRLLTIHAAKGLEFPVVALANMNSSGGGQRGPQTIPNYLERRLDISIGAKEAGYSTPGFEAASELEEEHAAAERLRLLYVAATRAEDYLVLPIASKPEKAKGLIEKMVPFLPSLEDATRGQDVDGVHVLDPLLLPPTDVVPPGRQFPITDEEREQSHRERAEWQETVENLLESGNTARRVVTASSQKGWDQAETDESAEEISPIDRPVERNLALRIGNALHGALEQINIRRHTGLDETVLGLINSALDDAEVGWNDQRTRQLVRDMVERVLGSDLIRRARGSAEIVQEVEFGYGMPDGGMIQGQMDLMFVEDGEIVVGDFKSDNIGMGEAEARTRSHYAGQAAVYAYAANQVTSLPVREVIFHFARTGEAIALPGDEMVERGREIALEAETQILGLAMTE